MSLINKLLEKAQKGKKLVAIRFDRNDSERMHIGRVIAFNEELVVLNGFNQKGQRAGQIFIEYEEIVSVEFDDTLLRRIQHWIEYQAQIYEVNPTPSFLNKELSDYESILKVAKSQNRLIDFTLDFGLGGFGYVVEIDEAEFMLRLYNSYGDYEGVGVFGLYDIEELHWDTPDIRAIELMIDNKMSLGNGRG